MRAYKCDICGKEVEYEHMLESFPAYNPVTQDVEMKDHCQSCLKRALTILTVTAMTRCPELEFDMATELGELITDMGNDLKTEALKLIADRDMNFKAVFTKDPARFLKEEDE